MPSKNSSWDEVLLVASSLMSCIFFLLSRYLIRAGHKILRLISNQPVKGFIRFPTSLIILLKGGSSGISMEFTGPHSETADLHKLTKV